MSTSSALVAEHQPALPRKLSRNARQLAKIAYFGYTSNINFKELEDRVLRRYPEAIDALKKGAAKP